MSNPTEAQAVAAYAVVAQVQKEARDSVIAKAQELIDAINDPAFVLKYLGAVPADLILLRDVVAFNTGLTSVSIPELTEV
ncbi:hypothetical protein MCERH10_02817 [Caulobacteraceae bacterium]|eukprot:gene16176-21997_t